MCIRIHGINSSNKTKVDETERGTVPAGAGKQKEDERRYEPSYIPDAGRFLPLMHSFS